MALQKASYPESPFGDQPDIPQERPMAEVPDGLAIKALSALYRDRKGLLATTGAIVMPADLIVEVAAEMDEARRWLRTLGADPGDPRSDSWVRGNVAWAEANPGHPGRKLQMTGG